MDDKLVASIIANLLSTPAYAALAYIFLRMVESHKTAIEYWRKRVEDLENKLVDCYKGNGNDKSVS